MLRPTTVDTDGDAGRERGRGRAQPEHCAYALLNPSAAADRRQAHDLTQGALDLAIFYAKKGDYKPQSDIWAQYKDMPWNDGKDKIYNVPWTPVTTSNVDALLAQRSK